MNYFQVKFPKLYYLLFHAKEDELIATRKLASIPFGLISSIILYKYIISQLIVIQNNQDLLFPIAILVITFGYSISLQFRTLTWLLIPFTFSYLGRSYLYLLYFHFLAKGPAHNVVTNSIIAGQTLTCSLIFHYNLTSTRLKLSLEPIYQIMIDSHKSNQAHLAGIKFHRGNKFEFEKELNDNADDDRLQKLRNETSRIDKMFNFKRNRVQEIETRYLLSALKDASIYKYAAKYQRLNQYNCESLFNEAVLECFKVYDKAYADCKRKFVDYLCKSASESRESCFNLISNQTSKRENRFNSKQICGQDLMVNTNGLKKHGHELEKDLMQIYGSNQDVNLNYFIQDDNYINPKEILENANVYLDYSKEVFTFFAILINILSNLIFLFTLYFANCYHNNYLRKIYFDNKYTTSYFKHVDKRREEEGKANLLPLRHLEKMEIFDNQSIKLTEEEKMYRNSSLRTLIPIAIASLILCVFDQFLLDILVRTKDEYLQMKKVNVTSKMAINIIGSGSIAERFRKSISSKKYYKNQIYTFTNQECLPRPMKTNSLTYKSLIVIFGLILVYIYVQPYMLRLRHVICGFFYPKREKKRILYLYNSRLKKRKHYDDYQIERLRASVQQNVFKNEINIIQIFAYKIPILGFLRKYVQIPCTICQERIDKDRLKCGRCALRFCKKCWKHCKRSCPACHPIIQ